MEIAKDITKIVCLVLISISIFYVTLSIGNMIFNLYNPSVIYVNDSYARYNCEAD